VDRHVVSLVGILGVVMLVPTTARARDAPSGEGEFARKVMLVETKSGSVALEKVQVKRLGEQAFLVGRVVNDKVLANELTPGTTMWLALGEVRRLTELDTLHQLRKAVKQAGPSPNEQVDVEEGGMWWPAEVLEVKQGRYLIHYVDYDSSYDTWVTRDRIRRRPRGLLTG